MAARSDKRAVARQVRPATWHPSRAANSTAGRAAPTAAPATNAASGCHRGLTSAFLWRKIRRSTRPVELDLRGRDEAAIERLPDSGQGGLDGFRATHGLHDHWHAALVSN